MREARFCLQSALVRELGVPQATVSCIVSSDGSETTLGNGPPTGVSLRATFMRLTEEVKVSGPANLGNSCKAHRAGSPDGIREPGRIVCMADPHIGIAASRNHLMAQIAARLSDPSTEESKALAIMIDAAR